MLGIDILVPPELFADLMAEVKQRVDQMPVTPSRYENLAALARLHQEFGNRLSKLIYQSAVTRGSPMLACSTGCATCCDIPSSVTRTPSGTYWMSVLDEVTLIENYAEIKAANPGLVERTLNAVEEARQLREMVRCPHMTAKETCGIYEHRPMPCKIWFSADLRLCSRNRVDGYSKETNPLTDASNGLRDTFEVPFVEHLTRIAPDLKFGWADFLLCLEEIAKLDQAGLFATMKEKVDAAQQAEWDPFGEGNSQ